MLERARDIEPDLVRWRRDIHKHPELGFQETRTAARVAEDLEDLGYEVRTGIGRTGVVGASRSSSSAKRAGGADSAPGPFLPLHEARASDSPGQSRRRDRWPIKRPDGRCSQAELSTTARKVAARATSTATRTKTAIVRSTRP